MSAKHDELKEAAKKAINAVFGDLSVTHGTTRESLEELIDEIRNMLDTLPKSK